MPVPAALSDLSQAAGSNFPSGGESPTTMDDYLRTYASFIALLRDGKGFSAEIDVASGATCDIGAASSIFVRITGTNTITSLGANFNGPRFIRFAGALTLTHNATTLILPGGANIAVGGGDTCIALPIGSTGWRIAGYQSATSPSGVAVGAIQHFPAVNAPAGFLKVNGDLVSRTTYAALWAFAQASGNLAASDAAWTAGQFSPGDGATTFRLPRAGGYHIRSLDDGAGIDAGRTIGSIQADQMPAHGHSATVTDPGHVHTANFQVASGAGYPGFDGSGDAMVAANTSTSTTGVTVSIGSSGTGTETRVKSIAWLACIKF